MIILGLEQGFKPSPIFNLHVFYSYFISGSTVYKPAECYFNPILTCMTYI